MFQNTINTLKSVDWLGWIENGMIVGFLAVPAVLILPFAPVAVLGGLVMLWLCW